MAAGPWIVINDFKLNVYKKLMDLANDSLKIILLNSTSNISKTMSPATYAVITGELATANGYTAGGFAAGSPTLSGGGAVDEIKLDTADATVTASGGNLVAKWAALYDNSSTPKCLIAFCLLNADGTNYTELNGSTLTIQIVNVFGAV